MNTFKKLGIEPGRAICYSGFRENQRPGDIYPDYDQVKEDLLLLQPHWKYLRMYDCDQHTDTVLEVIKGEKLDFQMMLGAYIEAEMNNFNCLWGGIYSEEQLATNKIGNQKKIDKLAELANSNRDIVFSVSVGNEACVDWTDHFVHEKRVAEYVKQVKSKTDIPVTFCENYAPWLVKLESLAEAVDFISLHTYPVWEYKHIQEALDYTKENYYAVAKKYPDKAVVITEAGWATNSDGRGINPESVNETYQKIYFEKLMQWVEDENILTFFFEAFDETWKGSPNPLEPEKHWGLFKIDRSPKLVMKQIYSKFSSE
jgi:exo-beta-1,3-glucanase (GH17 family)